MVAAKSFETAFLILPPVYKKFRTAQPAAFLRGF